MKVRMLEASGQAAALAFLIRHNSLWAATGPSLDHLVLVAETVGGQLLGMLTYVPGRGW